MKKFINVLAAFAVVGVLGFVVSGSANAEGDDSISKTASEGDSMTTLARSIVAEQGTAQKVSLSNEAKTYAETTIVQTTGAREINVGESVVFKKALVSETITKANKLTAEEISAWKPYADLINFGSSTVAGASSSTTTSEKPKDSDVTAADTAEAKNLIEDATKAATTKSSSWYWWPIGLITLGGLYYILGGKPGKDTE